MKATTTQLKSLPRSAETGKVRILKIQSFIRVTRWDSSTVPELRLCGAWLEKLGFNYGEKVQVKESEGQLIITPFSEQLMEKTEVEN